MSPRIRPLRAHGMLAAAALMALALPGSASAHAELKSSDPADGATEPSPFSGPLILTFSEALADGSKADLIGPDGSTVAAASIDPAAATMTFKASAALAPGAYRVMWTSIADDGDLLRGIVKFTVAAAASAAASEQPTPEPSAASQTSSAGTSDIVVPIVIALILGAAGAFYLVRRNRPA